MRQAAVGLNYIDVYFRTGLYKAPPCPLILGMEGAGTVAALGAGRDRPRRRRPRRLCQRADRRLCDRAGDRRRPAGQAARRHRASSTAAAMMLQGMTAQYLLRRTYKVKPGDTIVVHAAAGGVGLIMCQWAKHLGATVIGVVSTEEKAELARAHGAAHVRDRPCRPGRPRSSASPAAPWCRWSTTASARTRSWPASTAWPRSGMMVELRQRLRPGAAGRYRHARPPRAACT